MSTTSFLCPNRYLSFTCIIFLLVATNTPIIAQTHSKLSFRTALAAKYSVGTEVRKTMELEPGGTINYPKASTFDNTVYSIEFTAFYSITKNFLTGISSGISVIRNESNPLTSNQYFNRVMAPVCIRISYNIDIHPHISLLPEISLGHQFLRDQFGYTEGGFLYEQSGGVLAGVEVGISTKIGKYSPSLNFGYELNRIQNDVNRGWYLGLISNEIFEFSTNYHLFKVALAIKL